MLLKMLQLTKVLEVIDIFVYLFLLVIGMYFINHGGVWGRFTQKYTNFADSEADLHELPTILTYIDHKNGFESLEYGRDFNVSLQAKGAMSASNLTEGENVVGGTDIRVYFEVQKEFSNGFDKYAERKLVGFCLVICLLSNHIFPSMFDFVF